MIKVNKNTKVFIITPYHKTGGPKSLHQLGSELVGLGIDTYMVYYWDGEFIQSDSLLYPEYHAKISVNIHDDPDNILIVPESQTEILLKYEHINKVVWWLSLDYYFMQTLWGNSKHIVRSKKMPKITLPLVALHKLYKNPNFCKPNRVAKKKEFMGTYHLYNCEYVATYLRNLGINETRMSYLCGPLEDQYLELGKEEIIGHKEDIITYNPAKIDKDFLEKVHKSISISNNTALFVPIENMTRSEVYNILKRAKIYIDFGYFPGPERLPREAVASYCLIVSSNCGSAANDIDVAIPRTHKFAINDKNIKNVANLIQNMIAEYEKYLPLYDTYRNNVERQILEFNKNIDMIFERSYR